MAGAKPRVSRGRGGRPFDQVDYPQADQSRMPFPLPADNLAGTVDTENGGTGTSTTFSPNAVIIAGPSGVYTTDPLLQFDLTNKRLGVGITAPTVRLDVVAGGHGAVLTPGIRFANTTPATGGAQNQWSPALVFSAEAWDPDGAGASVTQRAALYQRTFAGSAPGSYLACGFDAGSGVFADSIYIGTAQAGDAPGLRFADGNLAFRNAGRGIFFTSAPLTDSLASVAIAFSADVSGGNNRLKSTVLNGYVFIEGNNFSSSVGTIPMMDFRGFDQSVSSPIMQIRLRGTPGGSVANGFGSSIRAQANSSTTADQDQGAIDIVWADVTHATRSADFVVRLVAAAAAIAEKFRFRSTGLLTFGGVTSSQPALKPSSAELQARLADDSAYAAFRALRLTIKDDDLVIWDGRARVSSPADSQLLVTNAAADNFDRFMLGGTTSSFPAVKRNAAVLEVKLADDSNFTELKARYLRVSDGAFVVRSSAAFTDAAGAAAGTLANAPTAGDPAKWVLIDDNGTSLAIPAWAIP